MSIRHKRRLPLCVKVFDARQDISVVGIAGPGDPMCDADKTLETFRLVKKDFPHVMALFI